jgi:hypothetical protein
MDAKATLTQDIAGMTRSAAAASFKSGPLGEHLTIY